MENELSNVISELKTSVSELTKQQIKSRSASVPLSGMVNAENSDFSQFVRNGRTDFLQKSLSSATGEHGGYLMPGEIVSQVHEKIQYLSSMRSIANTMKISTHSVDLLIDDKSPEAGWSAEDDIGRAETSTPEIRKIQIKAHEIYAKPKVCQKLLDDAQINVEEWLLSKIAEKMANVENDAFINGDGVDKPRGFLQYESSEAETRPFGTLQHFCTGANGAFADDESAINVLLDMVCSLQPKFVKNAKWIMSRSALAAVRKIRTKDGACIWSSGTSEAAPTTLLGYPVVIDDDMPQLLEGEESISIAFGDFSSGYQIVDRQDLHVLRDPYTSKPFVEFYATKRTGGAVVDFDAIKLLKFSAN